MSPQAEKAANFLLKKLNRAIWQHGMIEDGDRVAVAVSGGWDSLTLLELLRFRQRLVQEQYTLLAIHVVGDTRGPVDMLHHAPLFDWLEASPVPHQIVPLALPKDESLPLSCHRCTWNRRKTIFETAHEHRCNKIAFGHHADDMAETAMLNLLRHGRFETMVPQAEYFGGTFRLIRPLMYLRKHAITRFARLSAFPSPPPECPRAEDSYRTRAAELIQAAENWYPKATKNILAAIHRSQAMGSRQAGAAPS